MKALVFRPKILITFAFIGMLIFAFQNCQQGGPGLAGLRSTCVSNCDSNPSQPNEQMINVSIFDGDDGRLDLQKSDTDLTVFGSCSRGGYPVATVTARLKRSTAPNPTKTLSANCIAGGWQVNFTDIQDYSPNINSSDLILEVSIIAQDSEGASVYPLVNGSDTVNVVFAGTIVTPSPSPGTGGGQTLSIYQVSQSPLNARWLTVYAYLYPCTTIPSSIVLNFTNETTNSSGSYTYSPIPYEGGCVISMSLSPGTVDTSINANTGDATKQQYLVGLSIPSTNLTDSGYRYFPPPTGANPNVSLQAAANPYCYFTADASGQAKSVSLPLKFNRGPTDPDSFNYTLEWRNLSLATPWQSSQIGVSLNGSGVGYVRLNASAQNPNPNNHLMIYRAFYQNSNNVKTRLGIKSDGRNKSSNGECP